MLKNEKLDFATGERRGDERRDLEVTARAHSFEMRPYRVQVSNLSRNGCQLDASIRSKVDGQLYLDFAGLPLIGARIVWMDDYYAGCEFVNPLTEAEFQILIQSDWRSGIHGTGEVTEWQESRASNQNG
jgi:PilZ domain-containing protein